MLSREIMGVVALIILWVNTGLVLAVALKQLRGVLALRGRLREALSRGELVLGEVSDTTESGPFAIRRIHQTGRAMTTRGPERILFTDGPQSFEILGGTVATASGAIVVPATQAVQSEVWPESSRAIEAVERDRASAFDRAFAEASKFKGYAREVAIEVRPGDRVWVRGRRDADRLAATDHEPLLVSMIDPIAWTGGRARLLVGFVLGALVLLALVTGVALWPPHFGLVSTIGGALGLAYFLAIQPLGTAVRDAVKTPARQMVGALWQRPPAVAALGPLERPEGAGD